MRQAFTLVEMMIAIFLFSLITLFLSSTLQSLRQNNAALQDKNRFMSLEQKTVKLLKEDILSSTKITISASADFTLLSLETHSSLYNIGKSFVNWFVHPQTKQLIRSESAFKLAPPFVDEELHQVHLDPNLKKLVWFKAYRSKDKQSLLIALNYKQNNLLLEILTPQYKTFN